MMGLSGGNITSVQKYLYSCTKMFRFPNKYVREVYLKAKGHTFTYSPIYRKFFDENKNSDYNYTAMEWLMDNKILVLLPMTPQFSSNQYKVKEINHV
jgi:hypothetical protein